MEIKIFFEYAFQSSLGKRVKQEDSILTWTSSNPDLFREDQASSRELLAILADGLGGHVGGELASQIVCNEFRDFFQKAEGKEFSSVLNEALHAANRKITETVQHNPEFLGMASTILAVFFFDKSMLWISVGDCLLYLFRQGKLTMLNEDHSVAPHIERENALRDFGTSKEISFQRRNILKSALTGGKISLIDLACCPLKLENADCIVLASDGILTLSNLEIENLLSVYAQHDPKCVVQSLIDAVERTKDPNQDNTSVLVVRPIEDPKPCL